MFSLFGENNKENFNHTGTKSQLGSELRNLLDEGTYDVFDSKSLGITDQRVIDAKFDDLKPAVVYHYAAYMTVDNAED